MFCIQLHAFAGENESVNENESDNEIESVCENETDTKHCCAADTHTTHTPAFLINLYANACIYR